jgi:hypothetical protein
VLSITVYTPCSGFVRQKKAEKDATYYLIKDATLFPLFSLMNTALHLPCERMSFKIFQIFSLVWQKHVIFPNARACYAI